MGKSNRERRAEKRRRQTEQERRRAQQAARSAPGGGSSQPTPPPDRPRGEQTRHGSSAHETRATPTVDVELLWAAARAVTDPSPASRQLVNLICSQTDRFSPVAKQQLTLYISRLWAHGWLPYDVVRYAARQCDTVQVVRIAEAVAGEVARMFAAKSISDRWLRSADAAAAYVVELGPPRPGDMRDWLELLYAVSRMPRLATIAPPPGSPVGRAPVAAGPGDQRQLDRVRALLAKAESTTFEAEAEALSAKAQELIARYSLDQALLATTARDAGALPVGTRIWIDDPYTDPKSSLVARVAEANRCSCVWDSNLKCVTLFGFDHDVAAVELLYTSLLAQATASMIRHGSVQDYTGQSRTRSFRRSFLQGFAHRIGIRLSEVTAAEEQAAITASASLLPVLAGRQEQVEAAFQQAFPDVVYRRTSVSNAAGWHAGKLAADLAQLGHSGAQLTGTR